jgi:Flp pilus assembly CpaE family ATPase
VIIACWAAKGGSGTTVVACSLAVLFSRRGANRTILCDLDGDAAACLGIPEPAGPGLTDLLAELDSVAPDAIGQILVPIGPGLDLLPRGRRPVDTDARTLLGLLDTLTATVVIDAGTRPSGAVGDVVRGSDRSILVTRPCYLALRHALDSAHRPSDVVLVDEPGRALGSSDVEAALGVPVCATIGFDPAIARAVDAGLLASRLPRRLARALDHAA